VELFFVLSGFLITGILLRGEPTGSFVAGFYFRRALRLFPLYYVVLAAACAASVQVRQGWPYYVFYTANVWVARSQRWSLGGHFWSLAVEEQFYLLWPLIVLWTPRAWLKRICVALVATGLISRFVVEYLLRNPFGFVLLPANVDSLAAGALLALSGKRKRGTRDWIAAGASALATLICWRYGTEDVLRVMPAILALPFFYVLIAGAARRIQGPAGWVLDRKTLQYLGRISYGLYVIHSFVPHTLRRLTFVHSALLFHGISIAVLLGAASISWRYFEGPIHRSRDRLWKRLTSERRSSAAAA
jgi:peptidoglycan/LPS O-acetylase OafA/YrhL